jgi:hypothetical protein
MPGTTHASMHSAPLRNKSDALRSSARSGYIMRRLRHAVSRPCDVICAVLEPSAVLRVVRYGRCCSHTSGVPRADRRRVEPTAPMMRRLSLPAGCGGCSVRGKPRRCLQDSVNRGTRVRHHPRPRTTARSRFSSRSGSEWTVGAAPARSRCPPGPPWPGLARGRAAERACVRAHFFGGFARAWERPLIHTLPIHTGVETRMPVNVNTTDA